jgi:hypothetical protein
MLPTLQTPFRIVTAPDADWLACPSIRCIRAERLSLGAFASCKGASFSFRLIFQDEYSGIVGVSCKYTLVAEDVSSFKAMFPGDDAPKPAYLMAPADEYQNPPIPILGIKAVMFVVSVQSLATPHVIIVEGLLGFPAGVQG